MRVGNNNQVLPQLKEFLTKVPSNNPFFIQVGYEDPHFPFTAKNLEPNPASLTIPKGMPDLKEVRDYLSGHIGAIHRLDSMVGKLLDYLDQTGLSKNTLVIFIGDNGAALLRGKGTLYDTGLHVPLLVRWPGMIKPGTISDCLISGEDILPTLLDVAGAEIPSPITGKSFVKAFTKPSHENHDYIFAERGAHGTGLPVSSVHFDLARTIFNKDYKLIYNALWQLPYTPVDFDGEPLWQTLVALNRSGKLDSQSQRLFFSIPRPMFELYNLKTDPYEMHNLANDPAYSSIEYKLKATLQNRMILQQDYLPLPLPAVAKP